MLFTVVADFMKFGLGMALALLLHERFRGQTFFRAFFFLPWAIPSLIAGLTWKWMYDGTQIGLLNMLALRFGLSQDLIQWLGNYDLALWSVMLAVVYVLAGATIRFASQTGVAAVWTHDVSLQAVQAAAQLEDSLDQLRRLVVAPPQVRAGDPALWANRTFIELNCNAAGALAAMGYADSHPLSVRLADLARDGALVLALAGDQRSADAAAAAKRYAEAAQDLKRSIVA